MTINENAEPPAAGLSAEQRMVDDTLVVTLRGEIDQDSKAVLSEALLQTEADTKVPRVVADLSDVTFMDSVGINYFVHAQQQADGAGGWVRIAGAQQPVLRVLQLVGLDALIPCYATVDQALAD
ncbi:STAS domain-containing protein [Streptomyces sp. NPDC048224]|uniref:STAS domain-containing protein n=1 Tax=Streptomyces sp. NPDC048224 TaxID=3154500 RepID=UPI0033C19109